MKKIAPFIFCLLSYSFAVPDSSIIEQKWTFTLETANADSTFSKIISTAESKGGYFTNYSNDRLSLKIPVEALQDLQKVVDESGKIRNRTFSSEDKSTEFEQLNSKIESRKKLLDTYFELVKNAPFDQLQAVEREMVNLNGEIENLQGQRNALEDRAKFVSVSINLNIQFPPLPPQTRSRSPFEWIDRTDLNNLRGNF